MHKNQKNKTFAKNQINAKLLRLIFTFVNFMTFKV